MQVAAVIPGGGMLNAFISGFIKGAQLQPSQFDAIFAHSSAAHVSALFIAGQIELSKRIWVDELTKPGVFSPTNVLKGKRLANVDYLVDEYCQDWISMQLLAPEPNSWSAYFAAEMERLNTSKPQSRISEPY